MKNGRWWMFVCLLLTLLAGTSAGVVADRIVLQDEPRPSERHRQATIRFTCEEGELDHPAGHFDERRRRMLARWRERFDLSDDQISELQQVFAEHGQSAHDLWTDTRKRYCEYRESLRARVRGVLDESQLRAFESHLAERQQRRGVSKGPFL